jgi:hypothetical protein
MDSSRQPGCLDRPSLSGGEKDADQEAVWVPENPNATPPAIDLDERLGHQLKALKYDAERLIFLNRE